MTSNKERGKLAILVGGQYGSEGKGAVAAHLADRYDVHVRVGSPNAGHTIWWNGEKHVMQSIPCGWINSSASIVIGRGALINMKQLMKELIHIMQYFPNFLDRLFIDENAGILDERFHEEEGGVNGEMHHRIGSTGEGVGPARIARIQRDPSKFRLFKDVAAEYGLESCISYSTPKFIAEGQDIGLNTLIEGTQGSALSLLHSFWPYCTSVETNAAGIAAEVGIAPSRITDVIMVCRTFPIRVAGNSGPMENETSWDAISARVDKKVEEHTTVTKKVRRVAEWDDKLFQNAIVLNEPTEIALMFCDYIDPELQGTTDVNDITNSYKMLKFLSDHGLLERVKYFGTGPSTIAEVL